jgi:hypothetical protein
MRRNDGQCQMTIATAVTLLNPDAGSDEADWAA